MTRSAGRYAETISQIASFKPEFIVITGDLVNCGGDTSNWGTFFSVSRTILADIPIVPVIGNHDHQSLQQPYDDSNPPSPCMRDFIHPENGKWHSFGYRGCHFIILHVPDNGTLVRGDEQYGWLMEDLSGASTEGKPVFIFQHTPCFTSTSASWACDGSVLPQMLSQFSNVTVNFAGHIHAYERSIYPAVGTGKNFITTGGAGLLYPQHPVDAIFNPFQVSAANILHFCVILVKPRKSVEIQIITIDGSCHESFTLELQEQA